MKKKYLFLMLMLLGFAGYGQDDQQKIKEDFKPSSKNQPGQDYPQVNSQGYVRFRI